MADMDLDMHDIHIDDSPNNHMQASPLTFDGNQPRCCCKKNAVCTYITQYVIAVCFFVCGVSFLGPPMRYNNTLATWLSLFFFCAGASRFYFARAKQLALADPNSPVYGTFASKELSYFYVSNTALGGASWLSLVLTQICRLVLSMLVSHHTAVTSGFVYTIIILSVLLLMVPALSIGPKCFPPRTLKHSLVLKIFVVVCSIVLAATFLSATKLGGQTLTSQGLRYMQVAGASQLLYALFLLAGPSLLPMHVCEMMTMICGLAFWQPVSVVMGNAPGTQF